MSNPIASIIRSILGDGRYRMLRELDICASGYERFADEFRSVKGPKNILLCCPEHCNIGDHAIAYAERQLLKSMDRPYLEFSGSMTRLLKCLSKLVEPEDTIFLHGGGNMGTLYRWEEQYRCDIISLLPKNKIIMFPQTISYENTKDSQAFLAHTKRVYRCHKDLHLFARETHSFEVMKNCYPDNDVRLTPDIVLSLSGEDNAPFSKRRGALLCMRNDVEKSLNQQKLDDILTSIRDCDLDYTYTDTTVPESFMPVSAMQGEKFVHDKFDEFRSARLVVTDRLHGMIFSAITGTPCIALNNKNGKVGFEYEWLRELPYIHFIENTDDVDKHIATLLQLTDTYFPSAEFKEKFKPMHELLRS